MENALQSHAAVAYSRMPHAAFSAFNALVVSTGRKTRRVRECPGGKTAGQNLGQGKRASCLGTYRHCERDDLGCAPAHVDVRASGVLYGKEVDVTLIIFDPITGKNVTLTLSDRSRR